MKRYIRANYRSENANNLRPSRITDLHKGDLIYMTNGMYDVAIAEFVEYNIEYDRDGRKMYEVCGKVVTPLGNYPLKEGQMTNMYRYSNNVEVVV